MKFPSLFGWIITTPFLFGHILPLSKCRPKYVEPFHFLLQRKLPEKIGV